jgi:hypothetical protein
MILNNGHSTQFLNDYRDGKIPFGLKLGLRTWMNTSFISTTS